MSNYEKIITDLDNIQEAPLVISLSCYYVKINVYYVHSWKRTWSYF